MVKSIYIIVLVFSIFEVHGQFFDRYDGGIVVRDNIVIPNDIISTKLFDFTDQLAIVRDTITKKYGFINIYGDLVIPCMYEHVQDFNIGLGAVKDPETKKWGFINVKNEVVIPFVYDWVSRFCYDKYDHPGLKGLAYVNIGILSENIGGMLPDGKWGLINTDGKVVLPVKYCDISSVFENMAYFVDGDRYDFPHPAGGISWEVRGKIGFINHEGIIVIPPEYDYDPMAHFECGVVTLTKNGIEYKFNTKGELVE